MSPLPIFVRESKRWLKVLVRKTVMLAVVVGSACVAVSGEVKPTDGWRLYLSGSYSNALVKAEEGLAEGTDRQEWSLLRARSFLALGLYSEALASITNSVNYHGWSVRLRWAAREICLANGLTAQAGKLNREILEMVSSQPRVYRDAHSMVAFGQAALVAGADPKRVLENIYAAAQKENPDLRDVYLASGHLALEKHDYAMAAKKFEEGIKKLPEDPDLHLGLALAYEPSDPGAMLASVQVALGINSNHVPSLLLLVGHSIDAEEFGRTEELLQRIEKVNPWEPDLWSYRAVLAHLRDDPEAELESRNKGLKFWRTNPRVDHLIGKKLSENYRFEEGARYQRRALILDGSYLPAKAQLAQDLLRLGLEDEGWRLAEEVHKQDGYDVEAFNLVTLREAMRSFVALTNQHFLVRMSRKEAEIYGARVLELLESARERLCTKYGLELKRPVVIEIFPEQKDFAVRTFGMPGNPGYLGVCFGHVITANSPASSQGHPVNWEAVLWHEFCHVVTLQLTRNKMPRWLSEGISVYEELQENPAWGQRMNPRYREMIMNGELTPVSKLSGAFLAPPSPIHLQFAYFQSSLVVEFLIERYGKEAMRGILVDLGNGLEMNRAIAKNTGPLGEIEASFAAFARTRAERLAPGLDWNKPKADGVMPLVTGSDPVVSAGHLQEMFMRNPTNYYVLAGEAERLIQEKKYAEAKQPLSVLLEKYPEQTGEDSAYPKMALVHKQLSETEEEVRVLSRFAAIDSEAVRTYLRLMELGSEARDWDMVRENAKRYLAVNPLVSAPYRFLARAGENTNVTADVIRGYRALLALDPVDPAEVHYRLAMALHSEGNPAALKHVLMALEEAPRFREALALLLEIKKSGSNSRPEKMNLRPTKESETNNSTAVTREVSGA